MAYESVLFENEDEPISIKDLMNHSDLTRNTIKSYIDEHPDFERDKDGFVTRKN